MRWSILAFAFLLFVPSALAKELSAVKVCGADACRHVSDRSATIAMVEGDGRSTPPRRAADWYRIHFGVRAGPERDRFAIDVLPAAGYTRSHDPETGQSIWTPLTAEASRAIRAATRGLEPFPAAEPARAEGLAAPVRRDAGASGATLTWMLSIAAIASAVAGGMCRVEG